MKECKTCGANYLADELNDCPVCGQPLQPASSNGVVPPPPPPPAQPEIPVSQVEVPEPPIEVPAPTTIIAEQPKKSGKGLTITLICLSSVLLLAVIGLVVYFVWLKKPETIIEEVVTEKVSEPTLPDYEPAPAAEAETVNWYEDILSVRELTYEDIVGLTKEELRLLRNEIFARHGYIFQSEDLANHFAQFDWYTPVSSNVFGELSAIEKANVDFLKKYE